MHLGNKANQHTLRPARLWWAFKLKSGEIQKRPGTELRDCIDSYEVWDERIFQFSVRKDEIDDHWVQDTEHNHKEKYDVKKTGDTGNVPHPGDKIHNPLPFEDSVRGLLKLKPTKDMPRPGATKSKKKTAPKKMRG